MIKKRVCVDCGKRKNHSIHLADHRYVDPRQPGLNPIGQRMTRFNQSEEGRDYRARVRELGKGETPCQIQSPVCTGTAQHLHEDKTRGKSGGLDAAIRKGTRLWEACDSCNSYISENQVWARERGFVVRARDIDRQ